MIVKWSRANEIEDLGALLSDNEVNILFKPLAYEDLLALLSHAQILKNSINKIERPNSINVRLDHQIIGPDQSIQMLLNRCRKELRVDHAVLFSFKPVERSIEIVAFSGNKIFRENSLQNLIYSPVRDVAEDNESFLISEMNPKDERRFKYLIQAYPSVTTVVGVPVHVNLNYKYALFVFHEQKTSIAQEKMIFLDGVAIAIGSLLEQKNFTENAIIAERAAIFGQLAKTMLDQANNLVKPILRDAENLRLGLIGLEREPDKNNLRLVSDIAQKIHQGINRVAGVTKILGESTGVSQGEIIRVDHVVIDVIKLLESESEFSSVKIYFTSQAELVVIRSQFVVVEQILLNVILNAMQQIYETRPKEGGWVSIHTETDIDSDDKQICRIIVKDNGPGIHSSLLEKIYNIGFSTRKNGAGLGLYSAKKQIEKTGGRIYISKSHVLSGTTFIMEIPTRV